MKRPRLRNGVPTFERISQFELDNLGAATLDPSAWGKRGEAKTLAQQIIEATGINFQPADNDRLRW